jgi:hypothetical protein
MGFIDSDIYRFETAFEFDTDPDLSWYLLLNVNLMYSFLSARSMLVINK